MSTSRWYGRKKNPFCGSLVGTRSTSTWFLCTNHIGLILKGRIISQSNRFMLPERPIKALWHELSRICGESRYPKIHEWGDHQLRFHFSLYRHALKCRDSKENKSIPVSTFMKSKHEEIIYSNSNSNPRKHDNWRSSVYCCFLLANSSCQ